jgi:hypothetical protein
LSWADGDLSDKTFTIALANDAAVEPNETLVVTLSNVAGGATLDGSSTLTVTIANDDSTALSSGGGGGAMGIELLLLVGAALAAILCRSGFRRGRSRGSATTGCVGAASGAT